MEWAYSWMGCRGFLLIALAIFSGLSKLFYICEFGKLKVKMDFGISI
jgi:hypothetical protein